MAAQCIYLGLDGTGDQEDAKFKEIKVLLKDSQLDRVLRSLRPFSKSAGRVESGVRVGAKIDVKSAQFTSEFRFSGCRPWKNDYINELKPMPR